MGTSLGVNDSHPMRALIIVDMQLRPLHEQPRLRDLVPGIIDATRDERYDVVIASRFVNQPGSMYERLVGTDLRDADDVALDPQIAAAADHVVSKSGYSSITPHMLELLRNAHVRAADVCGIDTDQCVLATVLSLFDHDIEPTVLCDLCGSASGQKPHEAGLLALRRAVGDDHVMHFATAHD